MKACPNCSYQPSWHFCRNVSFTKKDLHFTFVGCSHVDAFRGQQFFTVADADRPAYEARWNAKAEELFAQYTKGWAEPNRLAFRSRIWAQPPPVIQPELIEHVRSIAPATKQADDDCPW